jgi:hypothetical protein
MPSSALRPLPSPAAMVRVRLVGKAKKPELV